LKDNSVIYGIRPVIEAIKSGKEIDKLFIQKGLRGDLFRELSILTKKKEIPFQVVPIEKLNRITKKNHQGVICYISAVTYQKIEDILPGLYEDGKVPLLLILDRITDVRNMGAVVRTAECAGVNAVIIPSKGGAQINEDAYKTSAGALNKIPVCRHFNLKTVIEYLKESGVKIISASEKSDKLYYQTDMTGPLAIIMGSEQDGVSQEYINRSNALVKIPIAGEIESLNVSVAAGIIIYEVIRQRG